MSAKKKTSIRVSAEEESLFPPGLGPTSAWKEIVARYKELIASELKSVRKLFKALEWAMIFSSCRTTIFRAGSIRGSVLSAVHAAALGDDEVRKEVCKKLASLSLLQTYALVRVIEEESKHEVI